MSHCVWSIALSWKHFFFHSKSFLFAQDMTILLDLEVYCLHLYIFKNLYHIRSYSRTVFYISHGSLPFWSMHALFHVLYVNSKNQKHSGKGLISSICSLSKLRKPEIVRKLTFGGER